MVWAAGIQFQHRLPLAADESAADATPNAEPPAAFEYRHAPDSSCGSSRKTASISATTPCWSLNTRWSESSERWRYLGAPADYRVAIAAVVDKNDP
jgi:hypothetical protein